MQHKLKPCTWAILAIYQEVKMYWLFCCCDQMAKPSQVGYWLFCCCDQMAKPSQVGYWLFCCCDQMAKPSQVGYWLFCCCDQSLSSGVLVVTVFKIEFPEIKEIIIHGYPEKKIIISKIWLVEPRHIF